MTQAHQLTEADLGSMTPHQINDARREGRLTALLGGDVIAADVVRRATAGERITLEDVNRLTRAGRSDLINAAHRDDRIDLIPNQH